MRFARRPHPAIPPLPRPVILPLEAFDPKLSLQEIVRMFNTAGFSIVWGFEQRKKSRVRLPVGRAAPLPAFTLGHRPSALATAPAQTTPQASPLRRPR